MRITLETPTARSLAEVTQAVATWQEEGAPVQLHPGDLGWYWRMGGDELAAALRAWRRDGEVVAVAFKDRDDLVRMALAPTVDRDEPLAARLVTDLSDPAQGVLPAGRASVEARSGSALRAVLAASGWQPDEPWALLRRQLDEPVEECGLSIEVVDARNAIHRVEVQRSAFPNSTFTPERWHMMAAAPTYARARCLLALDANGTAVAAVTVWSAGSGRPGLLEPLGVHRDHRGLGYGRAITLAAAAALRELGASSATVCTPSSNVAAVATYASAGFRRLADVTDFRRPN